MQTIYGTLLEEKFEKKTHRAGGETKKRNVDCTQNKREKNRRNSKIHFIANIIQINYKHEQHLHTRTYKISNLNW